MYLHSFTDTVDVFMQSCWDGVQIAITQILPKPDEACHKAYRMLTPFLIPWYLVLSPLPVPPTPCNALLKISFPFSVNKS